MAAVLREEHRERSVLMIQTGMVSDVLEACTVGTAVVIQTNSGCIIEGGLLTQVQTHAVETLVPINLAVL